MSQKLKVLGHVRSPFAAETDQGVGGPESGSEPGDFRDSVRAMTDFDVPSLSVGKVQRLLAAGMSRAAVARELGVSRATVQRVLKRVPSEEAPGARNPEVHWAQTRVLETGPF